MLRWALASALSCVAFIGLGAAARADWQQPVDASVTPSGTQILEGIDMASIGGVPYLAYSRQGSVSAVIFVLRLTPAGTWEQVGPNDPLNFSNTQDAVSPSIAEVNGRPYVAWSEADSTNTEIRVARLNDAGTGWENVGTPSSSPVNQSSTADAATPTLAANGIVAHLAWRETNGGVSQLRAARLVGDDWVQFNAGAPLNRNPAQTTLGTPSLEEVNGTVCAAWSEMTSPSSAEIYVSCLNSAGDTWQAVGSGTSPINHVPGGEAFEPRIESIFDDLTVVWRENESGRSVIRAAQPNEDSTGWIELGNQTPLNTTANQSALGPRFVDLGAAPYVAFTEGGSVRVVRPNGSGGWQQVGSALDHRTGALRDGAELIVADGVPYIAWREYQPFQYYDSRVKRLDPEFLSTSATASATGASLSMDVRHYGIPTHFGFDYGAGLEQSVLTGPGTLGSEVSTITQPVTGLAPSTEYQFRPFAEPGTVTPRLLGPTSTFATTALPDQTPPETTITKDPKNKLRGSKAKYRFVSSEPNSTFVCKFDKRKPKPCDAGKAKYKRLDDGKHRFKVYAVDAAGNADASPAKDKFKVI
jgi:hypothetical protein